MTMRYDIINALVKKFDYKSYLEIGYRDGTCFNKININDKVSVDPVGNPTFKMTSDAFFEQNKKTFDIIFVDGLHTSGQVEKDIINSLNVLNKGGRVVCHDMNPVNEKDAEPVLRGQANWNGDVWKAWVKLKSKRTDLNMYIVNTDWGIGVIEEGTQDIIPIPEKLEWNYWNSNREKYIISVEDFKKKMSS